MTDPRALVATLRQQLRAQPEGNLCVAFSGGPDSTALLHALAGLSEARARGLRAVHVDHGLHPDSGAWSKHCERFCADLQVPFAKRRVRVDRTAGTGLEAAARDARYAALGEALQAGEWLLLGHHRDDQAETVLLKLLRGAGPEGLGGMRPCRPLGLGMLWRPLLALSREQLRSYVQAHALPCLEDPSNADPSLARNRLRREILPRLHEGWPQAVDSILHSAALSRAAADTLEAQWQSALARLRDAADSLDAAGWLALDPALRGPLLDRWLHQRGLTAPTAAQRRQIERQCRARPGQLPCIRWPGTELHIWRHRLWAQRPTVPVDPQWHTRWQGEPIDLPGGGRLWLEPAARLAAPLTVRLRQGGERIRPAGDPHTRELRDLFQQGAVPPWHRAACPLLYDGDELLAVADRWASERGQRVFDLTGAQPRWSW